MTDDAVTDDAATGDGTTGDTPREATPEERRALFRVVRGTPSDAELAALTVVLAASARRRAPGPRACSAWSDPAARMRRALHAGPGAWHTSAWPR
jgi:acyl-CoA carboxylase epsilon subunit